MEENKKLMKRKNLVSIILVIVAILLLGIGCYMLFNKKDDKQEDNVPESELKVTEIVLSEEKPEQEVIVNGKKLTLKKVEKEGNYALYVNNVELNEYVSWDEIYSTGKYLLLVSPSMCGVLIDNAIKDDGEVVKVVKEYSEAHGDDGGIYYLDGESIKVENGKIVAEIGYFSDCMCDGPEEDCKKEYHGKEKVEFVYDGEKVTIKKVTS